MNYEIVFLQIPTDIFNKLQIVTPDNRAVQWHCAKRAEAHFWAEAPEIIP